jgi:light-regulated signal transduction histidine kinase (bacteriophytochrome)
MSPSLPDLSNCADEPIHVPGAIQPHGCLVSFDPATTAVWQASRNADEFIHRDAAALVGTPLGQALPGPVADWLMRCVQAGAPADEPMRWQARGLDLLGTVHARDGIAILEIERDAPDREGGLARAVQRALGRLSRHDTLAALLDETVDVVRALSGFDRTMVYRFDHDDHGEVVAESRIDGIEPYLGLHYPESDIPRQARELYRRNWIRAIPDARYTPVPIEPPLRPDTGQPLDLGGCALRSVSPVHLEYLANMGVQASMSVSLLVGGRLWGLISCLHGSPLAVPHGLRSACEAIGRLVSLQIGALEAVEMQRAEASHRAPLGRLVQAMGADADEVLRGLAREPSALLEVVEAAGAAIVTRDGVDTVGACPERADVLALVEHVRSHVGRDGLFVEHSMPERTGDDRHAPRASGLLAVTLPRPDAPCVVWFRPEHVRTVHWGGDPNKPAEVEGPGATPRLHPRRSFELWKQTVRGKAVRWHPADLRAAAELRRCAIEIDLARQVRKEQAAVRARDDLVAVVSHDLRTPMSIVAMQATLIQRVLGQDATDSSQRLRTSAEMIQRASQRMSAMLRDLLDLAKIEAGRYQVSPSSVPVDDILDDACTLLQPVAQAKRLSLERAPVDDIRARADPERVFQVLANLVSNAIKFSPEGAPVTLGARAVGTMCELWVRDEGCGIGPEQLPHIFERYWQAKDTSSMGTGLGLYIARGIVRAHGGDIRAESVPGKGSTFYFTLPLA